MYEIVRFYDPSQNKRSKVIKGNLTLEEAREHCSNPTTRKTGVYFDGYREE